MKAAAGVKEPGECGVLAAQCRGHHSRRSRRGQIRDVSLTTGAKLHQRSGWCSRLRRFSGVGPQVSSIQPLLQKAQSSHLVRCPVVGGSAASRVTVSIVPAVVTLAVVSVPGHSTEMQAWEECFLGKGGL